jgi:hypothetical protein
MKTGVLVVLVSFFTEQRRGMYEARLHWWNNTQNSVIVLDSANHMYGSESRFSNIRFMHVPGVRTYGTSRGEASSLLYLQKNATLSQYEWVVKITAKYIVPNLTSYLSNKDCNLYVQSLGHGGARNSEIFAFRSSLLIDNLRRHDFRTCEHMCWKCNNCIENWLHQFEKREGGRACFFPPIPIESAWRTPRTHGGPLQHL